MKISIKESCNENWNAMTPNEKGRFCDSCQKTVIDFSKMSDLEIYHALHNHKGKICGRLSLQQIDSFNAAHEEFPTSSNLKKWGLAAMLAGVLGYPSMTQAEINFQNSLAAVMPISNTNNYYTNNNVKTPVDTIVLAGKVVNGLQHPIANATIQVQGTNITVQTDSNGLFKMSLPKTDTSFVVIASADGYNTQTIIRTLESNTDCLFELIGVIEPEMIMGGLSVEDAYPTKVKPTKIKHKNRSKKQ